MPDYSHLYLAMASELPCAAIFVVDRDLRYVFAGGEGLTSAGMTSADFSGRAARELIPPGELAQFERDIGSVFDGATFTGEHMVGERSYQSHGKRLLLEEGAGGDYALIVSYDVTSRTLAEARIKLRSAIGEATRNAADRNAVIAVIADLLQRHYRVDTVFFGECDPATEATVGISGWSCEGDSPVPTPAVLIHADLAGQYMRDQALLHASGPACFRYGRGDDAVDVTVRSILVCRYTVGAVKAVFAVACENTEPQWTAEDIALFDDICALGWQAIERHRYLAQLHDANVKQNRFLAILGHELRNPLSAIQSALNLLRVSNAPQHTERAHHIVSQQFVQINRMMGDLVAVSQATKGDGLILVRESIDLAQLIKTTVQAIEHTADAKQHAITLDVMPGSVSVEIDRVRLTQVINNLLANAIKYTPNGGQIDISSSHSDTAAQIRIADNGIGMTEDTLAATFDMFGRGKESLAQAQDGLGVGMWLAKKFVDAHKGSITAFSAGPGKGSVITVSLPR